MISVPVPRSMPDLGPSGAALADALEQIAALLTSAGELHYASWVASDAESIRTGDLSGAEHFLSGFQGVGDLNDVVLPDAQADHKMRVLFHTAVRTGQQLLRSVDAMDE